MTSLRNSWIVWLTSAAFLATFFFVGGLGMSYAQSARCDAYARDFADRHSNAGGNILGGAMAGAAGGALLGGIIGGGSGAGQGAAIGAGVGALSGGAAQANNWQYNYDRAYRACMRGER